MQRMVSASGSEKRQYTAPALEKGLDILELLAEHSDGLAQAQIARLLGRSVGEIFRMVNVLERRAYVRLLQPGDRYVLSLKLYAFAHRDSVLRQLVTAAVPRMNGLARDLNQSCHLTVFDQGRIIVVAHAETPDPPSLVIRVGSTVPVLKASSGHLLLALAAPGSRLTMLRQSYGKDDCARILDEWRNLWDAIKKRGYEERESYQVRGVTNLSHPIFDYSGACVASLNVPFLERLDKPAAHTTSAAHPLIRAAAQAISADLGAETKSTITVRPVDDVTPEQH
jgi:DNA-binding IclR family transcriptional regulator